MVAMVATRPSKVAQGGRAGGRGGRGGDGEAGAGRASRRLLEKMKVEELLQGAEAGATRQAHARRFAAQKRRPRPRHHARDEAASPRGAARRRLRRAGPARLRARRRRRRGPPRRVVGAGDSRGATRRQSDPEALAERRGARDAREGAPPRQAAGGSLPRRPQDGLRRGSARAMVGAPRLEPPEKEGASRKARWMHALSTSRGRRRVAGTLARGRALSARRGDDGGRTPGTRSALLADAEIWLVDMLEALVAPLRYQIIVRASPLVALPPVRRGVCTPLRASRRRGRLVAAPCRISRRTRGSPQTLTP